MPRLFIIYTIMFLLQGVIRCREYPWSPLFRWAPPEWKLPVL